MIVTDMIVWGTFTYYNIRNSLTSVHFNVFENDILSRDINFEIAVAIYEINKFENAPC